MTDTKELSPVQVLREATIADLASEIGTARSVGGSAYEMLNCLACLNPSARAIPYCRAATTADRRHVRWVALTCIQAFIDSDQAGVGSRRIEGGHYELHPLSTSGRLPTFRAGFF